MEQNSGGPEDRKNYYINTISGNRTKTEQKLPDGVG